MNVRRLNNDKEVQTRTGDGALRFFETIGEAFGYAERHPDVWKVSWTDPDTLERVRFTRAEDLRGGTAWLYDPMTLEAVKNRHPSSHEVG